MTATRLATCLWFDGDGHDAAAFYVSLVPKSGIVARFPENADPPMLTSFHLDGVPFQALNGGDHYRLSPAASIVWHTEDQEETDRLWAALTADGGAPSRCGWLVDRFGLSWQIVPLAVLEMLQDPDQAAAQRAFEAMMQMDRLDIAGMREAVAAA